MPLNFFIVPSRIPFPFGRSFIAARLPTESGAPEVRKQEEGETTQAAIGSWQTEIQRRSRDGK